MTNKKHEMINKNSSIKTSQQNSEVKISDKPLSEAAQKIKKDSNRPAFHFAPPSNWINDPNGLIFYKGYFHLFYQHNPHSDVWGSIHWGHAQSKDLVNWEHLPIALSPSIDKYEEHCYSGCGYIKEDDTPMLFYTSIGNRIPQQWAAIPTDDQLINWQKLKDNPILKMEDHNGQIMEDWRDPFIFDEAGNTYMVIGGHPKNEPGSTLIYKALNSKLTNWKYLGILFQGTEENWECPNLFSIDDKYILIYSPHDKAKFYTGILNLDKIKFSPEHQGVIDYSPTLDYYAPNTLQMENGRRITFGWIKGFKSKQGWQGAISLPRDLSLDIEGRLIQKPIDELEKLRGNKTVFNNYQLLNSQIIKEITYPQFELKASFGSEGTQFIGFRFNVESGNPYEISITPSQFSFGLEKVKIEPSLCNQIFDVQLFFDRTIVEIFINNGLFCVTKVVYSKKNNLNFEIFCRKSKINVELLEIWEMNSIWK
jgi:beta-fructofuranosidase